VWGTLSGRVGSDLQITGLVKEYVSIKYYFDGSASVYDLSSILIHISNWVLRPTVSLGDGGTHDCESDYEGALWQGGRIKPWRVRRYDMSLSTEFISTVTLQGLGPPPAKLIVPDINGRLLLFRTKRMGIEPSCWVIFWIDDDWRGSVAAGTEFKISADE